MCTSSYHKRTSIITTEKREDYTYNNLSLEVSKYMNSARLYVQQTQSQRLSPPSPTSQKLFTPLESPAYKHCDSEPFTPNCGNNKQNWHRFSTITVAILTHILKLRLCCPSCRYRFKMKRLVNGHDNNMNNNDINFLRSYDTVSCPAPFRIPARNSLVISRKYLRKFHGCFYVDIQSVIRTVP